MFANKDIGGNSDGFSIAFEHICNFIAVARISDPMLTTSGLLKICLIEFPNDNFFSPQDFKPFIETLFGVSFLLLTL